MSVRMALMLRDRVSTGLERAAARAQDTRDELDAATTDMLRLEGELENVDEKLSLDVFEARAAAERLGGLLAVLEAELKRLKGVTEDAR